MPVQRAQNELAFRKRRVHDDGGKRDEDVLVIDWRAEIVQLRMVHSPYEKI